MGRTFLLCLALRIPLVLFTKHVLNIDLIYGLLVSVSFALNDLFRKSLAFTFFLTDFVTSAEILFLRNSSSRSPWHLQGKVLLISVGKTLSCFLFFYLGI